jgi:hypothetical protein
MKTSNAQRSVLLELSHGDPDYLETYHAKGVISRCISLGLISSDDFGAFCIYTRAFRITTDGFRALQVEQ